jgi:hypothetical protein
VRAVGEIACAGYAGTGDREVEVGRFPLQQDIPQSAADQENRASCRLEHPCPHSPEPGEQISDSAFHARG